MIIPVHGHSSLAIGNVHRLSVSCLVETVQQVDGGRILGTVEVIAARVITSFTVPE